MNLEIKHGQDAGETAEENGQADLAEASSHSTEESHTESGPSTPTDWPNPTMSVEEPEVPMPDPCVDPCDVMAAGTGIGM